MMNNTILRILNPFNNSCQQFHLYSGAKNAVTNIELFIVQIVTPLNK